ncbi:pilus assembly protein Flp/PilA [Mesocricetibacter intestinalis]|uniref:Pilus assembly protein Flp/PilA n=1 Tax=Mesocricetibacter intestinalis TaxID=1521930 RepID=A0A4R6V868_9PAST|nr:Flp family type IVb pilin [Mesocricetibacter intestinalis]TDQ57642.1 pilus assembly protein Flp/PilA [Mesocricetibacter intestinalis]
MLSASISNAHFDVHAAMSETLSDFKNNQHGVAAIEYGLIALAVAVFIVAVLYGDDNFIVTLSSKLNQLGDSVTALR